MAIESLKENQLVRVISAESTIRKLKYTAPVVIKQLRELVGKVSKVKTFDNYSKKCIVGNCVFVYEDLTTHFTKKEFKPETFNPENLVTA